MGALNMREVVCPQCGSRKVFHYTDAYVVRKPHITADSAQIEFEKIGTEEYDDFFYLCRDCEYRPDEKELLAASLLAVANERD